MSKSTFSNPYLPVETSPVSVAGQEVSKIAVRVADDSGEHQVAGILSKDYNLITNQMAYDTASDIFSRSGYNWDTLVDYKNEKRVHFNGRRYLHYFRTANPVAEFGGSDIHLGALLYNSYDGTSRFGFELYLLNMSCTNQYVSRNQFGFFAVRHTANGSVHFNIDDATQELSDGAQRALAVAPRIADLQSTPLSLPLVQHARKNSSLSPSRWGDVLERLDSEPGNAYGLYQALTFVTSHKLSGISAVNVGTSITDMALNPNFLA